MKEKYVPLPKSDDPNEQLEKNFPGMRDRLLKNKNNTDREAAWAEAGYPLSPDPGSEAKHKGEKPLTTSQKLGRMGIHVSKNVDDPARIALEKRKIGDKSDEDESGPPQGELNL